MIKLTAGDRNVFADELKDWLPERLFDAHIHVCTKESHLPGYTEPPRSIYRKFGGEFTHEACRETAAIALPGIDFAMNCFPHPDLFVDREHAAAYCGGKADNHSIFAMALTAPEDTAETLERRLRDYNLVGYKPYLNLVRNKPASEVRIPDMLPAEQMELADRLGLAVMLHIPRAARLADPINQQDMVEICNHYPNAKIIFAHIGRAYYLQNVIGMLDRIAACPNAYLDTAMVNHPGVLEYAFRNFPVERILFSSDAPVAWLRGKSVEINNQYAYLMGEDYRIGTAIYDPQSTVEFTFFYYEILRGIKLAAERANLTREQVRGILHQNADTLFSSVNF